MPPPPFSRMLAHRRTNGHSCPCARAPAPTRDSAPRRVNKRERVKKESLGSESESERESERESESERERERERE
eukprot:2646153-Pleurochrysis_carterae.AAC.1